MIQVATHPMDSTNRALAEAHSAYLSHRTATSAMALGRLLRQSGYGTDAQALLAEWFAEVDSYMDRAQLGIEMSYLGMYPEAETLLREAVMSRQLSGYNLYAVQSELAVTHYAQGRYEDAHRRFRALRDDDGRDLVIQQLHGGCPRPILDKLAGLYLGLSTPLDGKHVLVITEGGAGDVITHIRYFHMLVEQGASSVTIACPESVHPVIPCAPWLHCVVDFRMVLDQCDCVTWLFNLFARYQLTPYSPHASPPYVSAPSINHAGTTEKWRAPRVHGRRQAGIVWKSGTLVRHEPFRSMSLETLVPLFELEGWQFHSMHVGSLTDDEHALMRRFGISDLANRIHSFGDSAHIMSEIDLFIGVDTGPVHLAGALGCPVWVFLSAACDSRWYADRRFTPWYDSMRLYRQKTLGNWSHPITDMIGDLIEFDAHTVDKRKSAA